MGQCISRVDSGPYPFARQYDSESLGSSIFGVGVRHSWQGHAESKGAKKKEKNAAGGNVSGKLTRGVATSFGFRRRPASSSRAEDNIRRKNKDNNGNGGSTEDLRNEDVLSGRSTPLARARKDTNGQTRSNSRFGSRQTSSKTAKVADVSSTAAAAFQSPHKLTGYNNNAFDQRGSNAYSSLPPLTSQISPGVTNNVPGATKTVTKQTVILTYQPQQYAVQDTRRPPSGFGNRSSSVTRAYGGDRPPGKYTFQSNQLPRPQYPAVRSVDSKAIKQVANANRKIANSTEGWREGAGSAVSTDSGVWTGGEGTTVAGEGSPYSRRRPRNLEMVMKGTHTFHLRELQVTDFDIMDDAVVTGHAVIPLPKFPSTFEPEKSPDYEANPVPSYRPPSPILPRATTVESRRSPMSTLERYRNRNRPARVVNSMMDSKEEEKFVFDRIQPETLMKQNSFIKSPCGPKTVAAASTETSPSCKSEVSHCDSATDTWQGHAAGEALATRSNDDISVSLSVSSCDSEAKPTNEVSEVRKAPEVEFTKKTIVIENNPVQQHPLLMKSITLNQSDTYKGPMISSLTSSNYSTTSTCTNQSAEPPLTLTLEDAKFDMSVFDITTQSLLDDETSPADSLISSTSNSDSNNDLRIERDAPSMSSSAYQTANTKTEHQDEDGVDGEILERKDRNIVVDRNNSCKSSPESPGTPTHASNSLSLSDGRDFFDDEIADQPALSFRKNNKPDSEMNKQLRRSRETIHGSPLVQRNRKLGGKVGGGTERTPSLDTLSSLASDDLMMDNDLARSVTSLQSVDDFIERLDSSLRSGLNTLDERQLRQELASSKTAVRQWSQLLAQSNMLDQQLAAMTTSSTTHSLSASNNSLTNIGASLPVRTARLLQRSRAQTPSDIASSDGTASPAAPAPATLLQDVVDIKTLLLQLKRVLQEPREEHHSMSSETLDPLLAACAAESSRGNGRRPPPASPLHPDASAEMRRQIVFLQSQLEERDRLVKMLQQRMERMEEGLELRADDTCNVATQTDRLRPPMNTQMTISENPGLVSWNEHAMNVRKLPTYAEAQKTRRSVANGNIPVKCTCGARKNGFINGTDVIERTHNSIQLRNNSRVGTKYLQAIGSTENRHYIKRDSSVDSKSTRKPLLYSNRSKSIENFHNQIHNNKEAKVVTKNIVMDESTMRHHTSYGDLYNGCVSSKESVNGNRHSPSLNGQSTDTDYSSDGGYKSLPSNINCQQITPKRVSGIPRRSLESRFSPKYVKASAI